MNILRIGFLGAFVLVATLVERDCRAQAPLYRMEQIPLPNQEANYDEVNNLGLVRGRIDSTSFIYDSLGLIADMEPGRLYYIDELVDVPAPWVAFKIREFNDNGVEVVGFVEDANGELAACYADLAQATPTAKAELVLLGTNVDTLVADDINDDGDIIIRVGAALDDTDLFYVHRDNLSFASPLIMSAYGKKIGNRQYDQDGNLVSDAIISGRLFNSGNDFRYRLGDPLASLEEIDESFAVRDMNDDGLLGGVATVVTTSGKGRKQNTSTTNHIAVYGSQPEVLSDGPNDHGDGVNNHGDIVGDDNTFALLFLANPAGGYDSFYLDELVEDGPDKDFFVSANFQRAHSVNDFGQITLKVNATTGKGKNRETERRFYLLTPIDP